MPYYQFTVPTGGATLQHKAEVAAAMTKVHSEVTGAPGKYVHCSFVEVPAGSIFVAGEPVTGPRLVGLIRSGRSAEIRGELLHGLADAWCAITGDAKEDVAVFLHEVPGANVLEEGVILPETADDPGAVL
ncbi:phenylpyruvate tautomerase PptA (4-oxalocrotonate tautomerase family) [Pseudonocardia sediminis]|uniref:Phenylpyruvate tautomerase PptA (4-oxalocrotonate tautomerase family) n=1 Tax=Pseudonocardia sediminis TaxID=1397368 RepID=A0A4Q7URN4_PSEST|nr:tautomerase family protein [Pseudonocardia sediminis]RZT83428.1 phenylpyruvate tautomerase PptA (4-oxalocrotonate tautomerase family) [Pseudonocardia sediminis]